MTNRSRFACVVVAGVLSITPSTVVLADDGVLAAAAEIGITPESVVLAGLQDHTIAILSRVRDAAAAREALDSAHASAAAAAAELARLLMRVRERPTDEDLRSQCEAAAAALQQRQDELRSAKSQLLSVATDGFSERQVALIRAWPERASHRLQAPFRVLDMPAREWRGIERALRAERRAERRNQPLGEDHAELLDDLRGRSEVIAAQIRLDQYGAAVEQQFEGFSQ